MNRERVWCQPLYTNLFSITRFLWPIKLLKESSKAYVHAEGSNFFLQAKMFSMATAAIAATVAQSDKIHACELKSIYVI